MSLNEVRVQDIKQTTASAVKTTALSILIALSFCHLLNDLVQSLLPSIYPILKKSFHLNFAQVGFITLTFQVTASVLQPLIGLYTDKRPMPYSLVIGMGFTMAGLTLAAFAPNYPLLLVAACALVDIDGRVLLARRPEGKKMAGLWEFPGGKLNPGETPEAALIRELKEELGIDVTAACLAPFAFASHDYEGFHLLMPLFLCRRWRGIPTPRENQTLAWVRAARLTEYEMPPADKPLIPLLRDFL